METNSTRKHHADSLILPPRQMAAALRKSAHHAQRLAAAFDKAVPTAEAPAQAADRKRPKPAR